MVRASLCCATLRGWASGIRRMDNRLRVSGSVARELGWRVRGECERGRQTGNDRCTPSLIVSQMPSCSW